MENKPVHEPGEPTLEDLAQKFSIQLGRLHGMQALFLARHHSEHLLGSQEEDMFQSFESEQIEIILNEIKDQFPIPWRSHPEVHDESYSDTDASADTYIDPVKKSIVRYEAMEAEGGEQTEIIITYTISENGRLQQLISTQIEELHDALTDLEHPALRTYELPNGEKINVSSVGDGEMIEMGSKQAKDFVVMITELTSRLIKVYNQSGWQIMLDTEKSPNGVESGDPRAAYKIERID